MPAEQEASVGRLLDRLDLAAQRCQRATAQLAQHIDIAELAAAAIRPELATHHAALGLQRREGPHRAVDGDAEPGGEPLHHKWAVGARIPAHQRFQRVRHRLGEGPRQAQRHVAPEGVAVAGSVFRGDGALDAGDRHEDGPSIVQQ